MWLALIPVLSAATWWIGRRSLSGASFGRRVFLLAIRSMVLALLCAALAQPSVERRAKDVAVVAIRDVSASVPIDQQRLIDEFLIASDRLKAGRDRLGVISVARDAMVQTLPATGASSLGAGFTGDASATDLQQGIQLAGALVGQDAGYRVLLITDANQTRGSFIDAARVLGAAGVPLDVACVRYDRTGDVRLAHLAIPSWTRVNDTIDARVVVESGRECVARLSFVLNAQPVDLDPDAPAMSTMVSLRRGVNLFAVPVRLSSSPVNQLDAVLEPIASDDAASRDAPELLRASAVTFSSSKGRVLVLTEDPTGAKAFCEAITSPDTAIEVRAAASIPADYVELASYDAVVLFDEPASEFSVAQQEDLVRFVEDSGGGLLVVGGPNSLGAGGWIGTPLAEALPVLLDPPSKREMPQGALALVIDCSGSMGHRVGKTGATQQQIANEAAIHAVSSLSRLDEAAIISFNSQAQVVVPLMQVANRASFERSIRGIGSGGGTYMFAGVEAAASELSKSMAGVKHIVVLTDGQTMGDPSQSISMAADLRRRGITVSAVVIGDAPNEDLLFRLASAAGGNCYVVKGDQAQTLIPKIFIKEARLVRRTLIREGKAFTPTLAFRSDSMAGVATPLPGITGYVVTAERPGLALTPLLGPDKDPILAQWQRGLGRVTVFTSDAAARWNREWTGWSDFPAFWRQQLAWTMRAPGDSHSRVTVVPDGDISRVVVEIFDESGEALSFATVRARLAGAGEVVFRQTGPGRYEASVVAEKPGVHLLAMEYTAPGQGDGRRGSLRAAVVRQQGDELRNPKPAADLLNQAAALTRGRIYELNPAGADLWVRDHVQFPVTSRPIWLLVAITGLGLFLVDVASRRIAIDPSRMSAGLLGLFVVRPSAKTTAMRSLADAKARASVAMRRFEAPATSSPSETERVRSYQPTEAPKPAAPPDEAEPTADDAMSRLQAAKKRAKRE